MHHAVGVRIVMVQPEGVAEFMDRRLGGSFHQLLRSVVPESSDRDYRKTISDCRVTEHEVEAPVVEVDIGHGERSEEHTSELQSRSDLVCRLLLEKKKCSHSLQRCQHY